MFKKIKKNIYDGWELKHFDNSKNFRKYQYKFIKNFITGYSAEVGPGNGENLKFYMHKCKKIDLYEPSNNLFKNLKKKIKNKKIHLKNKKFLRVKNKYDTIIYLDVLEHIKNDKKELQNALFSLKKGGNLVINVPAFQHLYSKFDKDVGHFRRYNKINIRLLANKLKYEIKYIRYYDSVGYFLSLLSKIFVKDYKKNFEKKIKFWNSLIWISKLLDKLLFYSIGKSLVIIINKS